MRILKVRGLGELKEIMRDIKVDAYGAGIMAPKAVSYLIKINSLSNITANILKQEMLSLGGDVAVARGALTGQAKRTDCLVMTNLSQFKRLKEKLGRQPFGLSSLADRLSSAVTNYQRGNFIFSCGAYKINISPRRTRIMGVVNITPDSFSGDGITHLSSDEIVARVERLVQEGADIVDIGGESTRPGARAVTVKEELRRTIPVVKKVSRRIKVPVSIDTHKPEVARQALDNGAVIVNDITGLRDSRMPKIVASYKAGVIIMHMQGASPRTMQDNPRYLSLLDELIGYFNKIIKDAVSKGISREGIIIDPGIGFGKTLEHNLEILNNLREFKILGQPILVGPSRKSFIGRISGSAPQERDSGTIAACVLASRNGANIVRVHDIRQIRQALRISDAIDNQ